MGKARKPEVVVDDEVTGWSRVRDTGCCDPCTHTSVPYDDHHCVQARYKFSVPEIEPIPSRRRVEEIETEGDEAANRQ